MKTHEGKGERSAAKIVPEEQRIVVEVRLGWKWIVRFFVKGRGERGRRESDEVVVVVVTPATWEWKDDVVGCNCNCNCNCNWNGLTHQPNDMFVKFPSCNHTSSLCQISLTFLCIPILCSCLYLSSLVFQTFYFLFSKTK